MRSFILGLVMCGLVAGPIATTGKAEDATPSLQDLAWVLGEWEGEYILPDGVPELGPGGSQTTHTESWRWTLGKKFITLNIRDEINGKVVATGQEFVGIDEGTGKLAHWFFGSTGIHGSGQWSRQGDTWTLQWQGVAPNGKKQEGISDQILVDVDTYTWQMRDLSENGQKLPDWPKVTLKRKKSAASGEDTLWQAYRDATAGTWAGAGTISRDSAELGLSKGDQFEYHLTWTPDLEGKALIGSGPLRIADKDIAAEARALSGWDPETRQVRLLTFWSGGLVEEILLSRREKTAFLGTYVVKVPGEETNREPIRIEFPDPDHYIIRFVEGARKGDVLSSFKRESVVDVPTAEVPANYEHLKVLEPFFGPWVFEGPLQENISGFAEKGVRVRASIAYRWAVDKSAIVEDWSAHIEGKSPLKGVVLIGWDSKEKAIVDRSFTSDGGTWCSVWTVDGTTLTIKGCGIEADGTETSSVVFNKLTERGTMIWQAVEQIRAGEKLPDTAEYEYKPASR